MHASGGVKMMEAAIGSAKTKRGPVEVYAVTVLTSLSSKETEQDIYGTVPAKLVLRWANLAVRAGVQGIVCSALELRLFGTMRKFDEIKLIVPGTRSSGKAGCDQARIATPYSAIRGGADHLVIGRQITEAPDPLRALSELEEEIDRAF
jgi:orotidine-5'-phosphate decarboxylase